MLKVVDDLIFFRFHFVVVLCIGEMAGRQQGVRLLY